MTFETRFYDDESTKERVQELYTKLINDDEADFLISPYSRTAVARRHTGGRARP